MVVFDRAVDEEDILISVFDRFFQAKGGDRMGGMGLGLYISRQIAELHGGRVTAEFPKSGGTRMIVALPLSGVLRA